MDTGRQCAENVQIVCAGSAQEMRVKRPGVRVREARLRPGRPELVSWPVLRGVVYSPRYYPSALRDTPREEAREKVPFGE